MKRLVFLSAILLVSALTYGKDIQRFKNVIDASIFVGDRETKLKVLGRVAISIASF